MSSHLLLLDGYNLLFRSFTTLPGSISDDDGQPINAVYGLLAQIIRLWREQNPAHIVCTFDEPSIPTFRHRLYPPYQGQRGPMGGEKADDFARQVDVARATLPQLGVPAVSSPGFEADDVMGTLAAAQAAGGGRATIVSTDRDLLQLVTDGAISVLVPGKEARTVSTVADVVAAIGVPPQGITSYKALAGDASDNIPGVPGIGAKTAASLVNRYGSLEGIYENVEQLTARVGKALLEHRSNAFLFHNIVTVRQNIALPIEPSKLPAPLLGDDPKPRALLAAASGTVE